MSKRLLVLLIVIMLGVTGCIGVGYHGEGRIGSHGYGYVDLNILPYLGFFMVPGFFGHYDAPHHHGPVIMRDRSYIYRNPAVIIAPPRPYRSGPRHY